MVSVFPLVVGGVFEFLKGTEKKKTTREEVGKRGFHRLLVDLDLPKTPSPHLRASPPWPLTSTPRRSPCSAPCLPTWPSRSRTISGSSSRARKRASPSRGPRAASPRRNPLRLAPSRARWRRPGPCTRARTAATRRRGGCGGRASRRRARGDGQRLWWRRQRGRKKKEKRRSRDAAAAGVGVDSSASSPTLLPLREEGRYIARRSGAASLLLSGLS